MKKFLLVALSLAVLSGCGGKTETLTCSNDNTVGTLTSKTTYTVEHMNNKVSTIKVTYDYSDNHIDGVGTGTDGTTEDDDSENEDNEIIGGTVGEVLDDVVTGVAGTVMDMAGVKDMHNARYNNYNTIEGFTRSIDTDNDTNYKITYTYDLSKLSDNDITTFGISKELDTLRSTYTNRGLTCR